MKVDYQCGSTVYKASLILRRCLVVPSILQHGMYCEKNAVVVVLDSTMVTATLTV